MKFIVMVVQKVAESTSVKKYTTTTTTTTTILWLCLALLV